MTVKLGDVARIYVEAEDAHKLLSGRNQHDEAEYYLDLTKQMDRDLRINEISTFWRRLLDTIKQRIRARARRGRR